MNEHNESAAPQKFPRLLTGIDGFDAITGGGLPSGRISIVVGDTGTGKTVFSLQILANNVRRWNVPGIFVAFEECSRDILVNAASFGWDLATLENEKKIFFIDAYLTADVVQSGRFDLIGMLASITAKAQQMGAKFIVFDSIDALLLLLNDPTIERRECYRLRDWLRQSGLTAVLTARDRSLVRHGAIIADQGFTDVMWFMADCVIMLQQHVIDSMSLRDLRIVKYRGVRFKENAFPMVIFSEGIDVCSFDEESSAMSMPLDRVSSGIASLDALLGGGYMRGTSVLITGAPGSAKSTLAAAFAAAACLRGEQTMYVSFDQYAAEQVRDLHSVGIDLQPHIASGILLMYAAHSTLQRAEEHLVRLKALIRRQKVRCLVIDPLSAPFRSSGPIAGLSVTEQLLHHAWLLGVTVVFTCVSRSHDPLTEELVGQTAPIADTWIHLSYIARADEFKRSLLVIKSRGTRHDNRLHQMMLTDAGVMVKEMHFSEETLQMHELDQDPEETGRRQHDKIREKEAGDVAGLRRELKELRIELALLFARQNTLERQWKMAPPTGAAHHSVDKNH